MSQPPLESKPEYGNTYAVVCLLGLLPMLLLLAYGFFAGVPYNAMLQAVVLASLGSVWLGYRLLANRARRWSSLAEHAACLAEGKRQEPIGIHGDPVQETVAGHINALHEKIKRVNRDYADQTVKLMVYANDVEFYQNKIHAEERLRSMLSRYVGRNVVEKLMHSQGDIPLKSELREVTILFADIRSFTAISEAMPPEEVVAMLNEFFGAMVEVIFRHNGILDKFVGDQIMAVFGVLSPPEVAARDAVAAAVDMQAVIKALMEKRLEAGKPAFRMGIGINTGEVIVGNVGSSNHMDYTVIGDAVNVAAKLEKVAQGGQIIIGERTYQHCHDDFDIHKREGIKVKNREDPVALYEALIN